jgi:DNA polymerase/3'-5' exonuclease PolX
MLLSEAKAIAEEVKAQIADACESVVIAGSIRREKAEVGDIELVIVPRYSEVNLVRVDLFTEKEVRFNLLERRLHQLANDGTIVERHKENGSRIAWLGKDESRYIAATYQGRIGIDFFMVLPDRMDWYGWTLLLRTGPADANQLLVTRRDQHGIKPHHIFIGEGRVTDLRTDTPIHLQDEETVFGRWGMKYVPPQERSVENYWKAIIR